MPRKIIKNFEVEYLQILNEEGEMDQSVNPHLSEDMIKVGRDGWKKAFHYWKQYVQENKITYFEGYDKTLDNAIII